MELTYENIKSIILTILVVMSIILTMNLWSYSANCGEIWRQFNG